MKLEEELQTVCISKNLTLGLAESCTGGSISARITSIPGASKYFLGSIVSYHKNVKERLLNVSKTDLEQYSDVSEEVAQAMWQGLIKTIQPKMGAAGSKKIIVAGGMESMSNGPYLLLKGRSGYRLGVDLHQQAKRNP